MDPHQPHLVTDSTWHKTVPCEECHIVPAHVTSLCHIDTPLPAELTWGTLASTNGATPAYDYDTATCSGVYCHGGAFANGGGSVTQPTWVLVDSGSLCGTCHGIPPDPPHAQRRQSPREIRGQGLYTRGLGILGHILGESLTVLMPPCFSSFIQILAG